MQLIIEYLTSCCLHRTLEIQIEKIYKKVNRIPDLYTRIYSSTENIQIILPGFGVGLADFSTF